MHDPGHIGGPLGLLAEMEASDRSEDFIPAGLASLGIEADETELAVMSALHQLLWPALSELLELDLGEVEPEFRPDPGRAPR